MSRPPCDCTATLVNRCTSAGRVRSHGCTLVIASPSPRAISTVSPALSTSMSHPTTWAPSRANISAQPRPIPLPLPVTTATLRARRPEFALSGVALAAAKRQRREKGELLEAKHFQAGARRGGVEPCFHRHRAKALALDDQLVADALERLDAHQLLVVRAAQHHAFLAFAVALRGRFGRRAQILARALRHRTEVHAE